MDGNGAEVRECLIFWLLDGEPPGPGSGDLRIGKNAGPLDSETDARRSAPGGPKAARKPREKTGQPVRTGSIRGAGCFVACAFRLWKPVLDGVAGMASDTRSKTGFHSLNAQATKQPAPLILPVRTG